MDPITLETTLLESWRIDQTFARSLEQRAGQPTWVFYEGPPTANGRPGIHHVWARLFKDIYPRFHTMRGRYVDRRAGWDCHGLPVEVEVEKELGFSGKHDIEAYGIEAFNEKCRASVQRYVGDWKSLTERIGMWLDTDRAYWTMSPTYVESVWWLFHQLWNRDLIFEGEKVVPYCGRCGTALSSHELAQPGAYRDITDATVYVRFPLDTIDADLLVWTTTPWTLPSNVAAAVGPAIEYVAIRDPSGGRNLIVSRSRAVAIFGEDVEILEPIAVSTLEGATYQRPITELETATAPRVVVDEFVTDEDGSGIVHLAPAFGEIDRDVCAANGIAGLNPVGPQATFVDDRLPWAGMFVRDADPAILEALTASGAAVKIEPYEHSYPHCWRCSTPLIYWGKPTWFVATSSHKDELLRANQTVEWHPATIKEGRFGNWLENNVDWALSRDRFWGTPIPVWRCASGHDTCVSSLADLSERSGTDCSATDPHRPYVDDVRIACETCGESAQRVEPVLDAWFDSGSMPSAQQHFPFSSDDPTVAGAGQPSAFPADFICEGIDQTRGWFYSLLAINSLVFGAAPYRNVMCLALVVDKDGQKMSKSKGNVLDPWTVLDTRGADALRWNMVSSGSPWTTRRIFEEAIDETTRGFLMTLWNTYSFFVTYANLDGFTSGDASTSTDVMDRWMRSRLHHTVQTVTDALEAFDALAAATALTALVDDCSNWYVRRCRSRFWKDSDAHAHATLHEVLHTISVMLAPLCPFISDDMWRNLANTDESVHLQDWPSADLDAIDPNLEAEMDLARALTSVGRAARTQAKIKVRQPLSRARYLSSTPLRTEIAEVIAGELNVKTLEAVPSLDDVVDLTVVPNFAALGPRLGKGVVELKALLASSGADIAEQIRGAGSTTLELSTGPVTLSTEDVEIRVQARAGFAVAEEHGHAVALDTDLDDALLAEGFARELIRWLNEARKELDFAIADRIAVKIATSGSLLAAIATHREEIAADVLAVEWESLSELDVANAETSIDGTEVRAFIERVTPN